MDVLVSVDISPAQGAEIRENPHLYVMCAAGDLEGSGVVGGGAPNCAPLMDDDGIRGLGDDPLFARLKVAKPTTLRQLESSLDLGRAQNMGGRAVSEVRVWLQQYSHLRHPSSALSPAARSVAFVLAPTKDDDRGSVAKGGLVSPSPLDPSKEIISDSRSPIRALETAKAVIRELEARLEMASSRTSFQYHHQQQQQQQQKQQQQQQRDPSLGPRTLPPTQAPLAPLGGRWASWSAALAFSGLGFEDVPNLHLALAKAHTEAAEVAVEAGASAGVEESSGGGDSFSPGLILEDVLETGDEVAILAFIQAQAAAEKGDREASRPGLGTVPQTGTLSDRNDEDVGASEDESINKDEESESSPLFPCSVPASEFDDGGQVALRLHFERPPAFPFGGGLRKETLKKQSSIRNPSSSSKDSHKGYVPLSKNTTKIPRYEYLKVTTIPIILMVFYAKLRFGGFRIKVVPFIVPICTPPLPILDGLTHI
jgi:hypothetical protein